ncbi:signal peptidase II [Nocardioides sp. TF02-7]|uniref:signal peptidase II n=1 Tax=Nocardioides sp. TF02-7 TaxID=2917724 RepID=UPI001F06E963|nr:signal peptidase II [Nocardioides sp. TF02-7]UMG92113.1 signal peptidase II [Nocardioides sp. TF02-7]
MQAARGTPVDHETAPDERRRRLLASRGTWLLFAVVAGVLYAADQLSKRAAVEHLADGDVQVVGELLQLHLTRNPGAAFSLGTDFTVVLTCLAIAATVVVLWMSRGLADRFWAFGLGAMLAGITGNLTDRLVREPQAFHGHVIDFLQLPNWPIFNVADIAINVGAAVVLIQVFRGVHLDGTRGTPDRPGDDGTGTDGASAEDDGGGPAAAEDDR